VEHDASEIGDVTLAVAKEAIDDAGGGEPKAIGITNQRETVVAWDRKTGEPLAPAIVWQDRRTAERCAELKEQGREHLVCDRTGLVLDPYFSGTKIEWLIRHGGVDPAKAAFGTIDAWLIHNLCYEPDMAEDRRDELMDGWWGAIATTRNHSRGPG
jgi:glycerol kinase